MATLDDAAEALMVKLQGLDSEIEASEHSLQDFRGRIEATSHEVEQDFSALHDAVSSFLKKVGEEQERLGQESQQALHATADSQQAVAATGAEAHTDVAEGRGQLDALAQHATGVTPSVESLGKEAGEAPAHSLAQRAAQLEHELAQALDDAVHFLQNDVVHEVEQVGHDIKDRCQALRDTLSDERTAALQTAYDEWETKVDELEEYVSSQAFQASHQHAHAVVDYALQECQTAFTQHLDELHHLSEALVAQLQELATEAHRWGEEVIEHTGTELLASLDQGRQMASTAVTALGAMRDLLASRRFLEA